MLLFSTPLILQAFALLTSCYCSCAFRGNASLFGSPKYFHSIQARNSFRTKLNDAKEEIYSFEKEFLSLANEKNKVPVAEDFDLGTAAMFAGFAFDCYNDPTDVKWDMHHDGSKLAFISENFVRETFSGILQVTVLGVEMKVLDSENNSYQGGLGFDSVVGIYLEDRSITSSAKHTAYKKSGSQANWGDSFLLYAFDVNSAKLHILLEKCENLISDGGVVASLVIKLSDIIPSIDTSQGIGEWDGWLDLDPEGPEGVKSGIKLELRYTPFGYDEEQENEEQMQDDSTVPRGIDLEPLGGTPGINWRLLGNEDPHALYKSMRFERIAFIDDADTETQCTVWRDLKNRRILLAFRGTSHWRDLLTDASLMQEPLADLFLPHKEGTASWEAARLKDRRSTAMKLLQSVASVLSPKDPLNVSSELESMFTSVAENFVLLRDSILAKNDTSTQESTTSDISMEFDIKAMLDKGSKLAKAAAEGAHAYVEGQLKGSREDDKDVDMEWGVFHLAKLTSLPAIQEALEGMEKVSQNWGKITDPIGNIIALKENITELTSAMSEAELLQTALKAVADLNKPTNMPMIHSGFKTAYSGVRGALIDVIAAATGVKDNRKLSDWMVYCTGHSLGGALATLCSLDISRGCILGKLPRKVIMYNFGSPRVGNVKFVELYNLYNQNTFRVVNNIDIVTSLPRQAIAGIFEKYDHVGRTVVMNYCGTHGNLWIQGVDHGECPIKQRDAGIDQVDFIKSEFDRLQTILSGESVVQHLEPNYYLAFCGALGIDAPEELAKFQIT